MIQNYLVYLPNKRALTSHAGSTLSLGTEYSELRWLFYLAFDEKPHETLSKRKVHLLNTFEHNINLLNITYMNSLSLKKSICSYHVGRTEDFQKCKAICDVLKLWYQKDNTKIGDEIITLGISSNGICKKKIRYIYYR